MTAKASGQGAKDRAFEVAGAEAEAQIAEFAGTKTWVQRFQHVLHVTPSLVSLIVLLASIVGFGLLLGGKFFSAYALTLILQQVSITGIVGAAQALVILTGGIELSVGAIMVISSVVMGQFVFSYGLPPVVAVAAGLGVGAGIGWVNGVLVARMKLPPFIVTLGTWQIVLAANYLYSANQTIGAQQIQDKAQLLQIFGTTVQMGGAVLTYGAIFMLVLVFVLAYVLRHTAWGRHVYAVGDDPDAAVLAGVRTGRVLISVYTIAGLICAFAGWVLIGRIGAISPQSGQFENINSITAVVIGGISLFGGRGSILGMMFGALIVGVFTLGLGMYGTNPQWTYLLIGALIIAAVAVDQWIRKVSA